MSPLVTLIAIVIVVLIIFKLVKGILRGISLFILVLAVILTGALLGVKVKPSMLPVSVQNHVLHVDAGKTKLEVNLDEVVSVDAITVDGGVQVSGSAGGQLFNATVNKWAYKFALKQVLEKQLGSKFKDRTSGF